MFTKLPVADVRENIYDHSTNHILAQQHVDEAVKEIIITETINKSSQKLYNLFSRLNTFSSSKQSLAASVGLPHTEREKNI